jgi:hypothetical protein
MNKRLIDQKLIQGISGLIKEIEPNIIFLPYRLVISFSTQKIFDAPFYNTPS